MNRNWLIVLITIAAIAYLFYARPAAVPPSARPNAKPAHEVSAKTATAPPAVVEEPEVASDDDETLPATTSAEAKPEKTALHYKIRNGLMIVQGDIIAGAPRPGAAPSGLVEMRPLKLWPNGIVPYHIQPDVTNPERIQQAFAMFEGTPIRFVLQNGEADMLVFEPGEKDCLSYVGRMGGNQPVWLSPNCSPDAIAHEILHALGFVHEQNRTDRDEYVKVNFDNVVDGEADNFEKLPPEFMKVSGLGPFDFQSLMIYPQWMFAKNGQSTMEPLNRDTLIQPSTHLSAGDIERLRRAYSSIPN
jgi:hypothetical protein